MQAGDEQNSEHVSGRLGTRLSKQILNDPHDQRDADEADPLENQEEVQICAVEQVLEALDDEEDELGAEAEALLGSALWIVKAGAGDRRR